MKNRHSYFTDPMSKNDPRTAHEFTPARPHREQGHVVTAARAGLMSVALLATSILFAQTTPRPPNSPQTPASAPATKSSSTSQQPGSTKPENGWMMFNEDVGTRLSLKTEQMQELQDVDMRYRDRYAGLGDKPWTNSGYAPLTQERNTEIRSILSPQQYEQWTKNYERRTPASDPQKSTGSESTPTPAKNKP